MNSTNKYAQPRYYYIDPVPSTGASDVPRVHCVPESEALESICLAHRVYTGTEILQLITMSEEREHGVDFEALPHTELYEGVCDQVDFMLTEYRSLGIHAEVAAKALLNLRSSQSGT